MLGAVIAFAFPVAGVAQLVELLICTQWVGGSSPFSSFRRNSSTGRAGLSYRSGWRVRFPLLASLNQARTTSCTAPKEADMALLILFFLVKVAARKDEHACFLHVCGYGTNDIVHYLESGKCGTFIRDSFRMAVRKDGRS